MIPTSSLEECQWKGPPAVPMSPPYSPAFLSLHSSSSHSLGFAWAAATQKEVHQVLHCPGFRKMQKTLAPAAASGEHQETGEDNVAQVREAANEQGETAATQHKTES